MLVGSCLASRIVLAAVTGYLAGSLAHNVVLSWLLAGLFALGVVIWSKVRSPRSGLSCGDSCHPHRLELILSRHQLSEPRSDKASEKLAPTEQDISKPSIDKPTVKRLP